MLIGLFRRNFPLVLALTPLVACVFWAFSFYEPVFPVSDDHAPLYGGILSLFQGPAWIMQVLSILLICGEAVLVNRIFNRHEILDRETYLPAFFYVLLMSCLYGLLTFHPFILFNLFFIMAIRSLLFIRRQLDARRNTFMAGLYLGIASLCYPPGILLILHIWITLLILRPFAWREWVLPLIGAGLSYLYLLVYYFMTDDTELMGQLFDRGSQTMAIEYSNIDELKFGLFGIFGVVSVISILTLLSSFRTHSVRFRKIVQVLLGLAVVLGMIDVVTFFMDFDNYSIAPYAPIVSMLFGYYFFLNWERIFAKVVYYSTVVVILLNLYFHVSE